MNGPSNSALTSNWVRNGLLALLCVIAVTWFLSYTYYVTMPMAFAFYLAMMVAPIQRWSSTRLPRRLRWLSLALAMLAMVLALAVAALLIYISVAVVSAQWPAYMIKAQAAYAHVMAWAQGRGIARDGYEFSNAVAGTGQALVGLFAAVARSAWSFLAMLILILILAVLMLMEVRDWKRKLRRALNGRHLEVIETVDTIGRKVRYFMVVRTGISAAEAAVQGTWLYVAGVDLAAVWALLFFVLNFIPYLGSFVAVIPPVLMALLQYNVWWALVVLAGLGAIDQVMGNFVATRLQGKALEISPAILTLAVVYWGLVWGVAGALLAVPLTATIVIACDNVPGLSPVALLLSDTEHPSDLKSANHDEPASVGGHAGPVA